MFLFLGNAAKYLGMKGQVVYSSQMVPEKKMMMQTWQMLTDIWEFYTLSMQLL